ncbi:MAG: hypothetical protein AB7F78_06505, partial [Hyphomicrobiaceae bacterium]
MQKFSHAVLRSLALLLSFALMACTASAEPPRPPVARHLPSAAMEAVKQQLEQASVAIVDASGHVIVSRRRTGAPAAPLPESAIVEAIRDSAPNDDQIIALWSFLADDENSALATLPIVEALTRATRTPRARETLWSELSEQARAPQKRGRGESRRLLALFEQNRHRLLPLLPKVRETEGGGDEMARLMTSSRLFGDDIWQSLKDMVSRNPGAIARMIERERGRPVKWEFQGFEGMMRWKDAHLVSGAGQAPRNLDDLDAAGETFVTIFNALHSLDDWYRSQMLRGLGPAELFNAVVGGEQELYRLGTSGYRSFLHPIILKGIKSAGSFEAFLEKATPAWVGAGIDQ